MLITIDEIDQSEIDPFVIELFEIAGTRFNKHLFKQISETNKENFLKEIIKNEVKRLKEIEVGENWRQCPEKMGF